MRPSISATSRKLIGVVMLLLGISVLATSVLVRAPHPHGNDFTISCGECHTPDDWKVDIQNMRFKHDSVFVLQGVHREVNCRSCHTTLAFQSVYNQCNQCHQDIHQQSLGLSCGNCHSESSWLISSMTEMHQNSRFPLLGMHQMADCQDCHTNANPFVFEPLSIECFSCHQSEYAQTMNPNHASSGFSTECTDCHSMFATNWGTNFSHTFFPLEKAHAIQECTACHLPESFSGLSPECISCHLPDFQASINPKHQAAEFSQNCTECHDLNPGWAPAIYSHDYYPLPESHALPSCVDCHQADLYKGTSTECFACHEQAYQEAVNPNHVSSAFDTDCSLCHTLVPDWKPAQYEHTNFLLVDGHALPDCQQCHIDNQFTPLSTACFSCHQQDYQEAVNPNHVASAFDTDCSLCHTLVPDWKPAQYEHTNFPLVDGHSLPDCQQCHVNNQFTPLSTACFSCHQQDYQEAVNPNHVTAGFSTECQDCHTLKPGWESNFDHDNLYFPIYSGQHRNEWNSCTDCHTSGNYTQFSCIDCHEHNQSDMDDEHDDVNQYQYLSARCFDCHPTGEADDKSLELIRRY